MCCKYNISNIIRTDEQYFFRVCRYRLFPHYFLWSKYMENCPYNKSYYIDYKDNHFSLFIYKFIQPYFYSFILMAHIDLRSLKNGKFSSRYPDGASLAKLAMAKPKPRYHHIR